ncbi:MAG TPA: DegT/DnrJ/EryC1/StrS family aminotransferase [Pyrinomonadaceae bacterium]
MIRLAVPSIGEEDLAAVREALASGYLVQGARVAAFEEAVAVYVGARHAVAVSNCTSALLLALMALGVGPGDRVGVTTYSWPATANVIALCGAEPVFVEIDAATYNMDPGRLEEALACHELKAVLPVHAFGGMADMGRIMEAAGRRGVPVVEDAACALGAEQGGARAGTFGLMGCFSFHPRKAVTTGEGGVITTDDDALARRLRALRNHGQDPEAPAPDFILPGHNMRLTEFQAALGSTQLAKVERIIASRRAAAARYDELLGGGAVTTPRALEGTRHVYQSYVVLLPREAAPRRAEIIAALKARGVETTIGTYHMPLTSYFRGRGGFAPGDFPVTDDVAARALSLPLFEGITAEEQEAVASALEEAVGAVVAGG